MFPLVDHPTGQLTPKSFNLHFQETFFVSKPGETWICRLDFAFNLHFQETFFVSHSLKLNSVHRLCTFNLHFQETFFVSSMTQSFNVDVDNYFQSPFSGDFLCFQKLYINSRTRTGLPFNLHFQETFFVSIVLKILYNDLKKTFNLHFQETFFVSNFSAGDGVCSTLSLSISIFRRLSLFLIFLRHKNGVEQRENILAFNLHFQETFFVSPVNPDRDYSDPGSFQSPFSGDFLCFEACNIFMLVLLRFTFNLHFQETFFVSSYTKMPLDNVKFFQSPFSGDFLCF